MASATTNNARCTGPSLLDLPCEIRMYIYRFLFEDVQIRIHFNGAVDSLTTMLLRGRNGLHDIDLEGFPRSITQTCRLLRVESRPILRDATTTLHLCSPYNCRLIDPAPEGFLLSLPTDTLQHIRKLSVDWYLLQYVPLHSFHQLEVLKVTQVKCTTDEGDFTMEEALALTDQEAVRAIKDSSEEIPLRLRPPAGDTRRNYQVLGEALILESYGDFESLVPSLVSLFSELQQG